MNTAHISQISARTITAPSLPAPLALDAVTTALTPAQVVNSLLRVSTANAANLNITLPTAKAVAKYLGPDRDPHELPDREDSDDKYPVFPDPTQELTYNKPGVTFWMYIVNTGGTNAISLAGTAAASKGWILTAKSIAAGKRISYLCRFRDEHTNANGDFVEAKITTVKWYEET